MNSRRWFQPPHQLPLVFLAVALVSSGALAWLTWLLLQQDAALEIQRRQEALEQAADRAVTAMQRALADLKTDSAPLPDALIAISIGPREITTRPDRPLLYYPTRATVPSSLPLPFDQAERFEFVVGDLKRAERAYADVTDGQPPPVRAAALSRLARVRRKLRDTEGAIKAYDALQQLDVMPVHDLPAGFVARVGRASLFAETQRHNDLRNEAEALRHELSAGRWRLIHSEYEFYSAQVATWLGVQSTDDGEARVRAEGVNWLWENRASLTSVQQRSLTLPSGSAFVAWRPGGDYTEAIVGGPMYLASLCGQTVAANLRCTLTDAEGRTLTGEPAPARTSAVRPAAANQLPWTLHVSAVDVAEGAPSPRRQLLLSVLAVVASVIVVGWYFIVRAMARERRVSQLQSDFVAAVSHEFRSPLTSLSHLAEILATGRVQNDDDKRRSYDLLVRETDRLRRLVEDLLEFGRFEAGAALLRFEALDVTALVQQTVSEFERRVAGDGYRVELSTGDAAVYAHADREALARALWNLLDNAVKYSPDCRTIWVDLAHDGTHLSIAVRDEGLGIPAHEQRDIFDRFVRGADPKTRRIKGTGIGLAMVREIARAHGGEVQVTSEPGSGSRFTLVLKTAGALA